MGKTDDIETGLEGTIPIEVVSALIASSVKDSQANSHKGNDNNNEKCYKSGDNANGHDDFSIEIYVDGNEKDSQGKKKKKKKKSRRPFTLFGYEPSKIKWTNLCWLVFFHLLALVGYIYVSLYPVKFWTVWWIIFLGACAGFGVGVGAHRLFAHKSFKAHWLLRLALVLMETFSMNGGVYSYARDHRGHHKFVDTHGDPKNAKRGFFFAHIGWWMLRKHPDVLRMGKKLSTKDLDEEPLIVWQKRLYIPLFLLLSMVMPTLVPVLLWDEDPWVAFFMGAVLRTVVVVHHLFTVNSIAHIWGLRPYNRHIGPTESKITMYLSMGEGSHNYHHTFPMDYGNCEKAWWEVFNPATLFIDICEMLGLAWDLKKPSHTVIKGVVSRIGDPDFYEHKLFHEKSFGKRILIGIYEWATGIFVLGWAIYGPILFKVLTDRPLIVF